jgi:hypothetical protein
VLLFLEGLMIVGDDCKVGSNIFLGRVLIYFGWTVSDVGWSGCLICMIVVFCEENPFLVLNGDSAPSDVGVYLLVVVLLA